MTIPAILHLTICLATAGPCVAVAIHTSTMAECVHRGDEWRDKAPMLIIYGCEIIRK